VVALLDHLSFGFAIAVSPENLFYCLIGALLGTLIGVLPGLGPVATMAMLLPITFSLTPVSALIMLAGIYYGAQYGGSTTAILVNLPGESSSVVTAIDGYQLARQGRAGEALAVAAIGSFIAGCVATLILAAVAPSLTKVAQQFGPPEYFSLMCLGLAAAVVLASGSVLKSVAMVFLGLLLGMIGTDVNSSVERYTFDVMELSDGLDFVPLAMGLFGITEILRNLETAEDDRSVLLEPIRGLMPSMQTLKSVMPAIGRGTVIGSLLGILPGGGAVLSSFTAYIAEKKISKNKKQFGRGAIEGVAAPESANNAGAQTSFIPLLTLGIPSNAVMALMVGAMTIQGIIPGPQVMTRNPDLFWGMIASMWIGNAMLLVINLPLIGVWVRLLRVPYRMLFPAILLFCCIGAYTINNSAFGVWLMAVFGFLGYALWKLGFEAAPLLLGFVLGPLMEENLRRAMLIARGDPTTFVTRPISGSLLALAVFLLVLAALPMIRTKRDVVFTES